MRRAQALVVRLRQALTILLLEAHYAASRRSVLVQLVVSLLGTAYAANERSGVLRYTEFYVDAGAQLAYAQQLSLGEHQTESVITTAARLLSSCQSRADWTGCNLFAMRSGQTKSILARSHVLPLQPKGPAELHCHPVMCV